MKTVALLGALLLGCTIVRAEPLPLGTVELIQEYQGIKITLPIDSTLDVQSSTNSLKLEVGLNVNMADVQRNFKALAGTFSLPTDNCVGYRENIVAKLENAALQSSGNQAVINAKAHVTVWTCQKGIPGGGTTIEWKNKCKNIFGKKMCTKLPHKVTIKPGSDIKTKLAEDDVSGKVELLVASPDGTSVEITPTKVDVELHNDITKFLNSIAAMFSVSVNDLAKNAMGKLISAGVLKKAIPEEFLQYNPKVTALSFYTRSDGALGLKLNFTSELTGAQLTKFMKDALIPENATPAGPASGTSITPQ